ncbi:MAG: hypothetical protein KJZ73_18210 [Pseudorhodoplanes sp.]|nr:hypothetical protein [Pseudorhodoplanes sp.]MCL4713178.1 hypothetical protein [Pseudorhodoplanes sp.]MCQ3943399.1 hypothetical protein [Alphaproteobacteria bacterium]GIK80220.1 MAG: hypothetical protein BroJett024_13250 [Alphaproteobacteria bacterium]
MRLATGVLLAAALFATPAGARSGCELAKADTVVHGIRLGDAQSTIRVLGRDYRTVIDDPAGDFQWQVFASRDNKQLLMLRHHAGDLQHSFREIEIKFGRHSRNPLKLPVYEFITGNGTRLGQWRRTIVARMGSCFKSTRKGDVEILRYELAEEKPQSGILKATNMPQYYAEFEFYNGRLHRYRFGHDPV